MEQIPPWWFVLSGIFYVCGILMFLGLLVGAWMLFQRIRQFLDKVQPSIANVATKVEGVTTTVENLSHKVEGITAKVEGIADSVKGIADSARGVADSAKGTVQRVGGRAENLVTNLSGKAEETMQSTRGSQVMTAVMMGIQVFNAIKHMREQKDGHVEKNGQVAGNIEEYRGVEQSGSSSGS
jgi:uncharacterized protein YoxC